MPAWIYVLAAAAVAFVVWFTFARRWAHALFYSWRRAAHAYAEVEADYGSEPTFYGSMLPEEDPHAERQAALRARYGDIYAGPHELMWWEQTRAELAPEALDPLAAPPDDPGPGGALASSSPPPGPDQLAGGVGTADGMHRDPVASREPTRLADTGEIRDAHLLAEVAAELRAQDDDARAYCSALERDRQTYMHQLREVFA